MEQPVTERCRHWEIYFTPKDTYAQWLMAALTVFATAFSFGAFLQINKTLGLTREANDIARKNTELERRAWLVIETPEISAVSVPDFIYEDGKMHCSAQWTVNIKNVGNTPALMVDFAILFADTFDPHKFSDDVKAARKMMMQRNDGGFAIAPNETRTHFASYFFPFEPPTDDVRPMLLVGIGIVATYKTITDDLWKESVRTFHLVQVQRFEGRASYSGLDIQDVQNGEAEFAVPPSLHELT